MKPLRSPAPFVMEKAQYGICCHPCVRELDFCLNSLGIVQNSDICEQPAMSGCGIPGLWPKRDEVQRGFDTVSAVFFQTGLVFQRSLQIKSILVLAVTGPFFLLVQIVQSVTELRI